MPARRRRRDGAASNVSRRADEHVAHRDGGAVGFDARAQRNRFGERVADIDENEEGREEGRVDEARRLLIRLGTRRFGSPGADTAARLSQIDDLETLERLSDALLTATSWGEILRADER